MQQSPPSTQRQTPQQQSIFLQSPTLLRKSILMPPNWSHRKQHLSHRNNNNQTAITKPYSSKIEYHLDCLVSNYKSSGRKYAEMVYD